MSGGVSVGPYDVVEAALETIGTIELWRVAVQPGKPFAFGTAPPARTAGPPVLLFGLPGNPVSTFVTFELFVRPAIRRLAGHRDDLLSGPSIGPSSASRSRKSHGRRAFVRVIAERDEHGAPVRDAAGRVTRRTSPGGQGSHVISALAAADAPGRHPRGRRQRSPAGAEVALWWLDRA